MNVAVEATGMGVIDLASAYVERADGHVTGLDGISIDLSALAGLGLFPGGMFYVENDGASGITEPWKVPAKNGVTGLGLDYILNVAFRGVTPITNWFILLVDSAGWTGYNLADTMASHSSPNAWSENTNYSNTTRPAWSPGSPSANAIVNGTPATFAMTPGSSATIKGLALVGGSPGSADAPGGTGGTLFSTASFTASQLVNNGDNLKVTYTMSAANSSSNS